MLVVDSSVLVAWFRRTVTPQTDFLRGFLARDTVVLGDLVLMEVLKGARSDRDALRIEAGLASFAFEPMLGRDLAIDAARHYRRLRALGITVRKQIGLLIGTFCIAHDHELLHADRAFEPMALHLGLRVAGGSDLLQ